MKNTTAISTKHRLALSIALSLSTAAAVAAPEVHEVKFNYNAAVAKQTTFNVKFVNGKFTLLNPQVAMTLGDGRVECEKNNDFKEARLYLGAIFYVNDSIAPLQGTLMDTSIIVASGDTQLMEGAPANSLAMNINMNQVGKNVFDPIALVQAELDKAKAGGSTELEFLKKDHLFMSSQSVTLAGRCADNKTSASKGWEIDTVDNVAFMVNYVGSPNLVADPGLDVQVKPKVGPIPAVPIGGADIKVGVNPLMITEAELIAGGMSNYVGSCPAQLSMAVKMKGSGKGMVKVHVVDGSTKIWESTPIAYEGAEGWKQMNFFYNLPAMPEYLNVKKNRSFRVYLELKDEKAEAFNWSPKGDYDTFQWSHTCKSAPVVPMGGQGGIQQNQAPTTTSLGVKAPTPSPLQPQKLAPVQPEPTPPRPDGTLQAVPLKPTPAPTLKIAPLTPAEPQQPVRAP